MNTESGGARAPFTVFALSNMAFVDLLNELDVDQLSLIDEPTLSLTLNHHVLDGINVLFSDLSDNLTLSKLGGKITVNVSGGASLTDGNSRVSNIIS